MGFFNSRTVVESGKNTPQQREKNGVSREQHIAKVSARIRANAPKPPRTKPKG